MLLIYFSHYLFSITTLTGMTMYNRQEISTMMTLQHEEGVKRHTEHGGHDGEIDAVHQEEIAIIGK